MSHHTISCALLNGFIIVEKLYLILLLPQKEFDGWCNTVGAIIEKTYITSCMALRMFITQDAVGVVNPSNKKCLLVKGCIGFADNLLDRIYQIPSTNHIDLIKLQVNARHVWSLNVSRLAGWLPPIPIHPGNIDNLIFHCCSKGWSRDNAITVGFLSS